MGEGGSVNSIQTPPWKGKETGNLQVNIKQLVTFIVSSFYTRKDRPAEVSCVQGVEVKVGLRYTPGRQAGEEGQGLV